eukprot:5124577-Alexandrium_andersonii.AAC.1
MADRRVAHRIAGPGQLRYGYQFPTLRGFNWLRARADRQRGPVQADLREVPAQPLPERPRVGVVA